MPSREIGRLLGVIDRAYDVRSWHGTNLRGSLRGVSAELASWRPAPGRHDIWEVALHAAYWKYIVRRRLTGEPKGSFPVKGSDWFERPTAGTSDPAAWRRDRELLDAMHAALRATVTGMKSIDLDRIPPGGGKLAAFELVAGIAAHDLYHAGQIQLLKRMVRAEAGMPS